MINERVLLGPQFKQRLSEVKASTLKTIGVGVSPTSAYDIMAASQGYKDYKTARGLSIKPFYSWRHNIGSEVSPYYISKPIGHFDTTDESIAVAWPLLEGTPGDTVWEMMKDDIPIGVVYKPIAKGPLLDLSSVKNILNYAIKEGACAIHFFEKAGRCYCDVDRGGERSNLNVGDLLTINNVINELKTFIGRDAPEGNIDHALFSLLNNGINVDVRVQCIPTQATAVVKVTILDPCRTNQHITDLDNVAALQRLVLRASTIKSGLLLVGGVAGSGRSTVTSYLMRQYMIVNKNTGRIKKHTSNIGEREVVSTLLRSDPDVVCIGEIRTEKMLFDALKLSEKHIVIATIHATNVFMRLNALGASEEELSGRLKGVYCQCLLPAAKKRMLIPVGVFCSEDGKPPHQSPLLINEANRMFSLGILSRKGMVQHFGLEFTS